MNELRCSFCNKKTYALYAGGVCKDHFDFEAYRKQKLPNVIADKSIMEIRQRKRREAAKRRAKFAEAGLTTKGTIPKGSL